MESFLLYAVKVAVVQSLFWFIYETLLRKETYFGLNRLFLVVGIVASFGIPLLKWTEIVLLPAPVAISGVTMVETGSATVARGLEISVYLSLIYLAGVGFRGIKFGKELRTIAYLIRDKRGHKEGRFVFIPSEGLGGPFSFFTYIFYNPERLDPKDTELVFRHEKAHSRQWHSVDIILARLSGIILWFNPLTAIYIKSVRQNLEYLADQSAVQNSSCKKEYQYAMLKISGNTPLPQLVNPFYNSLIKKRIVMMQKSKSSKTQFLKPLMVLPVLALFLMAFNRETIYTYEESPNQLVEFTDDKQFEFLIDKSTTDAELDKLKTQLAKDDIDFSYTVVRNDEKEIIGLSLQVNGKNSEGKSFSGSFSTEEDTPIKPLILKIDDAGNSISFGNADFLSETEEIHFRKGHVVVHSGDEGDDEIHEIVIKGVGKDKGPMKWRFDSDSDAKTVDIRETDGKRTIIVDGKEISEGEWEVMEEADKGKMHKIRIGKIVKDKDKNVIIIKDSDDDEDIEVIETDGSGFFFVDNDEGEEPLYYVNGKKVTKKKFKELKPSQIESIEVRKGEKAIEKYGKKAVNGVIEVITKE